MTVPTAWMRMGTSCCITGTSLTATACCWSAVPVLLPPAGFSHSPPQARRTAIPAANSTGLNFCLVMGAALLTLKTFLAAIWERCSPGIASYHHAGIKPSCQQDQKRRNHTQNAEVERQSKLRTDPLYHQRPQAVDLISKRIERGDATQPTRHQRNRINGVTGEEHRHGQ